MINYLRKESTKIPEFLKKYQKGEKLNFDEILKNRIVYYPGSGFDVSCIESFNESLSSYIYIFSDYLIEEKEVVKQLNNNLIKGYKILFDYNQKIDTQIVKECKIDRSLTKDRFDEDSRIYCHVFIMEKENEKVVGCDRFVLVYFGMDGIFLYKKLFIDERSNLFGFVLQDHGFGCNYDCFGEGGKLSNLVHFYKIYPKYILADIEPRGKGLGLWKNFHKVIGAREMVVYGEKRYLCKQI